MTPGALAAIWRIMRAQVRLWGLSIRWFRWRVWVRLHGHDPIQDHGDDEARASRGQ